MSVTIAPFAAEHLEAAAALLAARHRGDRIWAPALSPRFEDPAAVLPVLQGFLAENGMEGVAAHCGGVLAGFLMGNPVFSAPHDPYKGFMRPRSAEMPFAGHAVDPGDRDRLSLQLYTALAQSWIARGLTAHYITVPHDRDAQETWFTLGFGRQVEFGVRDMDQPAPAGGWDGVIRRATPDDAEAIQALMNNFFRSFADPVIFVPYLPESVRGQPAFVAELLNDPGAPSWLAFRDGQLAAMQTLVEPMSPHWVISPLQSPDRCVYVLVAYTVPDARSTGIGAALFARALTWARDAGYECCATHYMTASRAAAFWRGLGFRPVSHWLYRVIDDRVTWANGRV